MRKYSVSDGEKTTTYVGFDREIDSAKLVLVTQWEDCVEVWGIDSVDSCKEFRRFVMNEAESGIHRKYIGIFRRMPSNPLSLKQFGIMMDSIESTLPIT